MSKFPYLPLCIDAYRNDTDHLSLEEHGAYLKLLMLAWRSPGCMLPDDDVRLARMLGVSAKKWSVLKPTVMAFWTLADGSWKQGRLAKEHDYVSQRVEKRRAAGALGGAANAQRYNDMGEANASPNASANAEANAEAPNTLHLTQGKKDTPKDPKGSSSPKGATTTRKHKLPTDWAPGKISENAARKAERDHAWMLETAEDMRVWAGSTGSTRENWDLCHAGWMRREAKRENAERERRGSSGKIHPFPQKRAADDRADVLQALKTGGQHVSSLNDQRHFDLGPVIEHQGDGRHDRDVPRAIGGGAGRFSEEGFRRHASPERR